MADVECISEDIQVSLVNEMVRCMLNPDNTALYLGKLDEQKVSMFMSGADDGLISIFWDAFHIALAEFSK